MTDLMCMLILMLFAGSLGGLANYLTTEIEDDEQHPLLRRVVVGAIAALAVPVFLKTISSELISESMTLEDHLVFAGFCLLAGFSSKAFLTSMSKGLQDRLKSVEDRQKSLESEVDPILEKETEPAQDEQFDGLLSDLSQHQKTVLNALANPNYTRRYLNGILAETALDIADVNHALNQLKDLQLVRHRNNKNSELYWLTQKGRAASKAID